ncbi:IPT/TIG domain-containing protein [Aquimarina longa]|uniref:IPT/TIG domain-containing protein n=1 Tax=Aquimarina longa TaxID=1080221 RepID=UPI00078177A0|nr:IPT/TIG domain-containing protein [Aquimarina longa]
MEKIYSIITLCFLIISCSSDDNTTTELVSKPTINNISTNSASIGDIIIINGKNFNPNETYIVKFNEIKGRITEITSTQLKVEVPENATSGKIILIYKGEKVNVGNLEVTIELINKLYGYVAYDKLVELNIDDGSELSTIATIGSDYLSDIVYSKNTNEIIGQTSVSNPNTGNNTYYYHKIDITTGQISKNTYPGYESLVITDSGKLYGYVAYDKLVELNINDGSELSTIATIGSDYLSDIVYLKNTNEIIGQISVSNPNTGNNTYYYYKIDITTRKTSKNTYAGYESLITAGE